MYHMSVLRIRGFNWRLTTRSANKAMEQVQLRRDMHLPYGKTMATDGRTSVMTELFRSVIQPPQ